MIGALLALLILSGCASMNKKECQVADWHAMGYQQGVTGQGTQRFNKYQSDCADHDIRADFQSFKQGHQAGLTDYCTYERGQGLGQAGNAYNANCSASRYPEFDSGYRSGIARYCTYDNGLKSGEAGHRLNSSCAPHPDFAAGHGHGFARYQVFSAIADVEHQLAALEEQISVEKGLIAESEALIISSDATVDQRTQALVDIKYHREEISRLKKERHRLNDERADLQMQLDGPGLRY